MSHDARPVNLDLTKFSFPFPAITSITHRITGVLLFVAVGFGLWLLDLSLHSEAGFRYVRDLMVTDAVKAGIWVALAALAFHLCAGVKHLVLDLHVGDSLQGGRIASYLATAASVALMALAGVWLW